MRSDFPWFVTWSTYGCWLPGDRRGFQTRRGREYVPPPRRYARPGEEVYDADDYDDRRRMAAELSHGAVSLGPDQQRIVLEATVERIDRAGPRLAPVMLTVGRWHLHLIAGFGDYAIRQAVGQFKQAGSIVLGPPPAGRPRWWVEGCHMRSLPDERAIAVRIDYLWKHVREGDLVHLWRSEFHRLACVSPGT